MALHVGIVWKACAVLLPTLTPAEPANLVDARELGYEALPTSVTTGSKLAWAVAGVPVWKIAPNTPLKFATVLTTIATVPLMTPILKRIKLAQFLAKKDPVQWESIVPAPRVNWFA